MLSALELTTLFALSLAEVHGIPMGEIERRRTLVMGIMLGSSGADTIPKVAERAGQHWAREIVAKVPVATLKQINHVLGQNVVVRWGTKQRIIVLEQVVPFGYAPGEFASLCVDAGFSDDTCSILSREDWFVVEC